MSGSDRPLLTARCRLVDEGGHDRSARHRRIDDGGVAGWPTAGGIPSFRSGIAIHQRSVPEADGRVWRRVLNGRLGNCNDNAAMQSFFSSLKTERIARKTYRTRE